MSVDTSKRFEVIEKATLSMQTSIVSMEKALIETSTKLDTGLAAFGNQGRATSHTHQVGSHADAPDQLAGRFGGLRCGNRGCHHNACQPRDLALSTSDNRGQYRH